MVAGAVTRVTGVTTGGWVAGEVGSGEDVKSGEEMFALLVVTSGADAEEV